MYQRISAISQMFEDQAIKLAFAANKKRASDSFVIALTVCSGQKFQKTPQSKKISFMISAIECSRVANPKCVSILLIRDKIPLLQEPRCVFLNSRPILRQIF